MTDHQLKITTYWFLEILNNFKRWEIRKNDRDFKVGDWLILFEHNTGGGYTSGSTACEVMAVHKSSFVNPDMVIITLGEPEEIADEYKDALAIIMQHQADKLTEAA